jgi:hypothetical protein
MAASCLRLRGLALRWRVAGSTTPAGGRGTAPRPGPFSHLLPVLLLSLGFAASAQAEVVITTNTTISAPINDSVRVIGNAVVSLVAGGAISGDLLVVGGTVNLFGGSIGGLLRVQGTGTVHVFGTCLVLAGGRLTGRLQSGAAINVPVIGPLVLHGTDATLPTIICPPSVMIPTLPGLRAGSFTPTAPIVQDNCLGVVITGRREDGFALTDRYPVGATTITWTAIDASGNRAECTQIVMVHDPVIVGVVGLDSNGSGLPDPLEPRLKGVVIELRDPAQDVQWIANPALKKPEPLDQTTTNEVGNFTFRVTPPGVYDVVVKPGPGQTISALFPGPSYLVEKVVVNGEPRLRVTMQPGQTAAGLGVLLK